MKHITKPQNRYQTPPFYAKYAIGRGVLIFFLLIAFTSLVFGVTGTVSTFDGQTNPFNISFAGNQNQSFILGIPTYSYSSNVSISIVNQILISPAQLLLHYTFDELTGNFSSSGLLNIDAEPLGAAIQGEGGKLNYSAAISNSVKNISIPPNAATNINDTGNISIAFWLNITNRPSFADKIFGQSPAITSQFELRFTLGEAATNNIIVAAAKNGFGSASVSSPILETGQWYHIVGIYNGETKNVSLYVNGSFYGTKNYNLGVSNTSNQTMKIGFLDNSAGGDYHIDDFRVYNTTLTSSDVFQLYNSSFGTQNNNITTILSNLEIYVDSSERVYNNSNFDNNASIIINNSLINSLLDSAKAINVTFHSDTGGVLQVNLTNATYMYGIASCTDPSFNYTILNMTYSDEMTLTPITAQNDYLLQISSPFSQSISGTFNNQYTDSICTNINATARGLTYDIYGTLNVQNPDYTSRIISNDVSSPYVTETNPFYTLPIYLLNLGNTSTVTFTIKSITTENIVEGASVFMYKYINGSYTFVEGKLSDITGKVQFAYQASQQYRFIVTASGFVSKSFDLNPITSSSYTIYLIPSYIQNYTQDFERVTVYWSPQTYYENRTNNFNITFTSPYSELNFYNYSLVFPGGTVSGGSTNPTGKTLTNNVPITGATIFDVVVLEFSYNTNLSGTRTFRYTYDIIQSPGNYTMISVKDNTYGLGLFERLLVTVIIGIVIVGITTLIGQAIPGMALALIVFGYLVYIGFIPIWSILISAFVGVSLLSARSE